MTTYNALQIIEEKKVLLKENLNLSVLNRISNSPIYKQFQLPSIPKTLASKIPSSQLSNYPHTHTQNPAQFSRLKLKGPSLLSKNSISTARKKYTQIPRSQIFISSIKNDKLKECDSLETGSKNMNQIEA